MSLTGVLTRAPLAPALWGLDGGESAPSRAARYGLVSAWNLEGLTDSYGANTLSNSGSPVTFVAGKVGNAGNFVRASTQFLNVADNASLSTGDVDYGGCIWVNLASKPASDAYIFEKANSGGAANDEYTLKWTQATDRFSFIQRGTGTITVVANNLGVPALSTYYFLRWWHDSVSDTINIKVNEGTVDSAATAGAHANDTTSPLSIGSRSSIGSGSLTWDGLIDAAYFFKSPPVGIAGVIEEIGTYLYNAGAGRAYPQGWT